MEKFTGQKLKKDLEATNTKLDNLEHKIEKKFNLILDDYREYLTDEDTNYLLKIAVSDMSINFKLGIIIRTEDAYVKATGNQKEMFN